MTALLIDTSVLVKWFHGPGESELPQARAIRDATRRGELRSLILDLALYELGNVLLRSLGWDGADVADQLDDLVAICGAPLAMEPAWLRRAAVIGSNHRLTFYDAAWAAAAEALESSLVSADKQLQAAGLAESPTAAAKRLRLPLGA
ncbi:MAG: PIN domain-containing protein [Acidimicrobiales bacterium]